MKHTRYRTTQFVFLSVLVFCSLALAQGGVAELEIHYTAPEVKK